MVRRKRRAGVVRRSLLLALVVVLFSLLVMYVFRNLFPISFLLPDQH